MTQEEWFDAILRTFGILRDVCIVLLVLLLLSYAIF